MRVQSNCQFKSLCLSLSLISMTHVSSREDRSCEILSLLITMQECIQMQDMFYFHVSVVERHSFALASVAHCSASAVIHAVQITLLGQSFLGVILEICLRIIL